MSRTLKTAILVSVDAGRHVRKHLRTGVFPSADTRSAAACITTASARRREAQRGPCCCGRWPSTISTSVPNLSNASRVLCLIICFAFCSKPLHAQWVETSLSSKYPTQCLAVSQSVSGTTDLFAGTMYDGHFLSTDDGASWRRVNTGLSITAITIMARVVDAGGTVHLYAGAGTTIRPDSATGEGAGGQMSRAWREPQARHHQGIENSVDTLQRSPKPVQHSLPDLVHGVFALPTDADAEECERGSIMRRMTNKRCSKC